MMTQVRRAAVALLAVLGPLAYRPERLLHPSPWLVLIGAMLLQLTLPRTTLKDMRRAAPDDKGSAPLILVVGNLVAVVPVVDFVARAQVSPAPGSAWVLIGGGMLAAGVGLRIWAMRTLGEAFTGVVDARAGDVLCTRGPYRVLRHPSYAGALLAMIAEAVVLRSGVGLALIAVAMLPTYLFRIRVEERALIERYGPGYEAYRLRTPALLPFI
jgi:protein-S-isoprenylcysteine O-methyltransferase